MYSTVRRFHSGIGTTVIDEAFRCAFRDGVLGTRTGAAFPRLLRLSRTSRSQP
jgi:hypothetical protein